MATNEATEGRRELQLVRSACQRLGLVDDAGEPVPFRLAALAYGSPKQAHQKGGNLYAALKGRRQVPRQVLVEVLGLLLAEEPRSPLPVNAGDVLVHYPADAGGQGSTDITISHGLCGWEGRQGWCAECGQRFSELFRSL